MGRAVINAALPWAPTDPVILMYHGVSTSPMSSGLGDCDGKHLSAEVFAHHLKVLRRHRHVISLQHLVEGLRGGEDMQNAVAITFDDGYENNFRVAAPLLTEFKMPAAFFLTTGLVGTDQCMWTDEVEILIARTQAQSASLPGEGETIGLGTLDDKRRALRKLKAAFKLLQNSERLAAIGDLARQLKLPRDIVAEGDCRFMTWSQAREMARAGFEMGAHTVHHPILARVSATEAKNEILSSRDQVLTELGQCSSTFCYPNGRSVDYTPELANFCSQHFRAALSANRGTAVADDLFELKRFGTTGGPMLANMEWVLFRGR